MRQSIYIILATTLIKADINRETKQNKTKQNRKLLCPIKVNLNLSVHMLQDIGVNPDGFCVGERFEPAKKAYRIVRYLRYIKSTEIRT